MRWRAEVVADLLSHQRLSSYLAVTPDLDSALALYEWNSDASAAVFALIARTEVLTRNAMDGALARWSNRRHRTAEWFDHVPLDRRGDADLAEARRRCSRCRTAEAHGKVIAELSFGFWRYLATSRYHASIWVPGLHTAFPLGNPDIRRRRGQVEQCLKNLHQVRNRVAHHEPIHAYDLRQTVDDARRLAGWIAPDAAAWIMARERVTVACRQRAEVPLRISGAGGTGGRG
ncbi:hypothetical protein BOX37_31695 [Nocardia mangyaensis]|uniref:CAAX protease n=1 Tax=Nocardia mangyaensis TaxID=2213200 RepID=A0A1J0W0A4_9NOCA|nr:hypothetical protein BOX37_31695 [Nocardia mangyaensis]